MASALVPVVPPDAALPVSYEKAKTALAECARVDECMAWANKAEALASYAKQADDDTLRKMCDRIQARAIRRCGELLKTFDSQGRRTDQLSEGALTKSAGPTQREAASNAGLSKWQETTAVRVSNVPDDVFERHVESEEPPTVTTLAKMGTKSAPKPPDVDVPAPAGFAVATSAIGSLRRFAKFCAQHDPTFVAGAVYPYEVANIRQDVAAVDAWLDRFVVHLKGPSRE